jgi:hypothetical protein
LARVVLRSALVIRAKSFFSMGVLAAVLVLVGAQGCMFDIGGGSCNYQKAAAREPYCENDVAVVFTCVDGRNPQHMKEFVQDCAASGRKCSEGACVRACTDDNQCAETKSSACTRTEECEAGLQCRSTDSSATADAGASDGATAASADPPLPPPPSRPASLWCLE